MVSNPLALANVIICTVIVVLLMFYRRNGARHRPVVSRLAYMIVLAYAIIPFRYLFGDYHDAHWLVVLVNLVICAAVLRARGNVARLIDAVRI